MKIMKLNEIRRRLISHGYPPDEVEYAIVEVLQYKNPETLKGIDLNILSNMLEEKMEITRAKKKSKSYKPGPWVLG
jgi:hypothetical protein